MTMSDDTIAYTVEDVAFAFVACCGLVGVLGVLVHDLLRKSRGR